MNKLATKVSIGILLSCVVAASVAQDLRAITEDGRKVLLSPDGRWTFDNRASSSSTVTEGASPYQPAVKRFSVKFDTTNWVLVPLKGGEETSKRTFRHKTLPIAGMVLSDEMPTTTDVLKNIIIYNAQNAGATTTILIDKSKDVGGVSVGAMRFAATMKGLDLIFDSNYYASGEGNIQVMCYTAQAAFFKYESVCEQFLSGLTIK